MKNITFIATLALLGVAAAQPHKVHGHEHAKRAIVTDVSFKTVVEAEVVVWVDEDGVAYTTSTVNEATAHATVVSSSNTQPSAVDTSITASATSLTVASASVQAVATSSALPSTFVTMVSSTLYQSVTSIIMAASTETPISSTQQFSSVTLESSSTLETSSSPEIITSAVALSSSAENIFNSEMAAPSSILTAEPSTATPSSFAPAVSSTAASQPASASPTGPKKSSGTGWPIGVGWDPSTGSADNCVCKSDSQVSNEFATMKDYGIVRIYGTDCNQVASTIQHAMSNGQKVILGIYIPLEDVSSDVKIFSNAINQYANGNWDVVSLVTVGNERVNEHAMTVSAVVEAIGWARGNLTAVGYNGPVGTVDTVPAVVGNPALCENSDIALVNSHAFFDPHTAAQDAGTFVQGQVAQVKQACGNKRVIVTETGWPYQGDSNGRAVPSKANQQAALDSLRKAFSNDIVLFSAFDSPWKSDSAGTFDAETHWGFL